MGGGQDGGDGGSSGGDWGLAVGGGEDAGHGWRVLLEGRGRLGGGRCWG